jgi:subtilisin-like proprotein convertase family protein
MEGACDMAIQTIEKTFLGPVAIPDGGTITPTIAVTGHVPSGVVPTLEVVFLNIQHSFDGDLDVSLKNPQGASIFLFNDVGGSNEGLFVNLLDAAPLGIDSVFNPKADGAISGTFNPGGAALLSTLATGNLTGNWTLTVADDFPGDVGTLLSWGLRVTFSYSGTVNGTAAADTLGGSDGADKMFGLASNDILRGFDGNDFISGGLGKDFLAGGLGNDRFHFDAVADTGLTSSTRDRISDFSKGDFIDVNGIDANTLHTGNQNFTFIGAQSFHHVAGELRSIKFDHAGTAADYTYITGDVNGDGAADFSILVNGLHNLTNYDFLL